VYILCSVLSFFLKICFRLNQNTAWKVRKYFWNRSFYETTDNYGAEWERERETDRQTESQKDKQTDRQRVAPQSQWEFQLNMAQQSRHFVRQLQHLNGSVGKCLTSVSDNTEVVFRSPVKSSYLSLILSPQTACGPTQAFCLFLTVVSHYADTYVTVSRHHCPWKFIHEFRRHIY